MTSASSALRNLMKLGKFEANLRAALPHPCAEFRYELSANPRRGSRSTLATHLKVRGETIQIITVLYLEDVWISYSIEVGFSLVAGAYNI